LLDLHLWPLVKELDDRVIFVLEAGIHTELSVATQPVPNLVTASAIAMTKLGKFTIVAAYAIASMGM